MGQITDSETGLILCEHAHRKLGFFGSAGKPQRSGAAQAAVTLTGGTALAGTLTGSADGTIADIAAAAGACAGSAEPSAAQVDTAIATAVAPIVSGTNLQLKELQLLLNKAIADNVLLAALVNELRAALVAHNFIPGS